MKPGLATDGTEKQEAGDLVSGQTRFLDLSCVDVAGTQSSVDMEVVVVFGFQPPKAGEFGTALSESAEDSIPLEV
jgi:hypothetical protein